jgi:hypothetical protein
MAASSAKDKAHALKDSYVSGLIEGGATAPAPAQANPSQASGGFDNSNLAKKMGMNTGDQASISVNLDRGRTTFKNDGDSTIYIKEGGETARRDSGRRNRPASDAAIANPIPEKWGKNRFDASNSTLYETQPDLMYYAEDEMDDHRAFGRQQAAKKQKLRAFGAALSSASQQYARDMQPGPSYNVTPTYGGGYNVQRNNAYGF